MSNSSGRRALSFSISSFQSSRSTTSGNAFVTLDIQSVGELALEFIFTANAAPRLNFRRLILEDEFEREIVEAITARLEAER